MNPSMHLVTFDLRSPGQAYGELHEVLRHLPGAVRYQQSSWILRWAGSTISLREYLRTFIDANDSLMVVHIASAAWLDSDLLIQLAANGYEVEAA